MTGDRHRVAREQGRVDSGCHGGPAGSGGEGG
jgi:hypothetical protein